MPSTRPIRSSLALVHLISGDLVQVRDLKDSRGSLVDVPPELRSGEVVQCLRNDGDGVLIARSDGSRVLVPLRNAREVGVRWFPESLDEGEQLKPGPDPEASLPGVTPRRWTGGPRPPRQPGTGIGPRGVETTEPSPPG